MTTKVRERAASRKGSGPAVVVKPSCPLCKNQDTAVFRKGIRGDPEYPVYRCPNCGLRFIEPPFTDVREYYRSRYRTNHDFYPAERLPVEERFLLEQEFSRRSVKEFISAVPEGASVLEVGCSTGGFLSHLQANNRYDLYGAEWDPEAADYVRRVGELPCEEGNITEIYPGKTFTAIAANHVLEHQPDPIQFIKDLKSRLIGGGVLYLEIPNATDAMISMYESEAYASFWYREPHITYWEAETLGSMLSVLGFEARVRGVQRYGLANHVNWLINGEPMKDPRMARHVFQPVPTSNRGAMALNRIWTMLDSHYRVQMETLQCADSLFCIAQRREI
jgi:SAM-dependent methyltransferase